MGFAGGSKTIRFSFAVRKEYDLPEVSSINGHFNASNFIFSTNCNIAPSPSNVTGLGQNLLVLQDQVPKVRLKDR